MVSKSEDVEWLRQTFGHYDWFHSSDVDNFNYAVLYVNYMNADVLKLTADVKRDIKIHFAGSILADRAAYTEVVKNSFVPTFEPASETDPVNVRHELFVLSRICGRDNLVDIFYEVHDGVNAVSFVSEEYPKAREGMQKLYDAVGFDILFEELDGDDD